MCTLIELINQVQVNCFAIVDVIVVVVVMVVCLANTIMHSRRIDRRRCIPLFTEK